MKFDLIHLNPETGELGRTPPNGVVNIGGVSGPTFTVHGKALLFADGTLSDGSSGSSAINTTLQNSYNYGTGVINLSLGKDFILNALNNKSFKVSASTGDVSITGNLNVPSINGVAIQDLGSGAIKNFEHVVTAPSTEWTVVHNLNSSKINVSVYDETGEQFIPNAIRKVSNNITKVSFNTAQIGSVMIFAA